MSGLLARAGGVLALHALQYGLALVSWLGLGRAVFDGAVGAGTVATWSGLLAAGLAARAVGTRAQGALAVAAGCWLRRRLVWGLRNLDPAAVRRDGRGRLLGQVLETDGIENFVAGGAVAGLAAAVELGLAAAVLSAVVGPAVPAVLVGWLVAAGGAFHQYRRHRTQWTLARLDLGTDLAEKLAGHRTRAMQERAGGRSDQAGALDRYDRLARTADRWRAGLGTLPRGWALSALVLLAAAAPTRDRAELAAGAVGMLLTYTAFTRLAAGLAGAAEAWCAWTTVRPQLPAGGAAEPPEPASGQGPGTNPPVLETYGAGLRLPGRRAPILSDVDLRIGVGDRILIQGPSGGGKSTLASLLSAARTPTTGTVRLHGQSLAETGARRWRQAVLTLPQADHNHLLLAPLAMNLLLGRGWPARPDDLRDAHQLCRALGLGELIDRMPAGLAQPVGETGWQLSQGERDLVYLARALLQDPAVLVLDETFGALDPPTHLAAVRVAADRASTLLVIRQ